MTIPIVTNPQRCWQIIAVTALRHSRREHRRAVFSGWLIVAARIAGYRDIINVVAAPRTRASGGVNIVTVRWFQFSVNAVVASQEVRDVVVVVAYIGGTVLRVVVRWIPDALRQHRLSRHYLFGIIGVFRKFSRKFSRKYSRPYAEFLPSRSADGLSTTAAARRWRSDLGHFLSNGVQKLTRRICLSSCRGFSALG